MRKDTDAKVYRVTKTDKGKSVKLAGSIKDNPYAASARLEALQNIAAGNLNALTAKQQANFEKLGLMNRGVLTPAGQAQLLDLIK